MSKTSLVSAVTLVALGATQQTIGPGSASGSKQQAQQGIASFPARTGVSDRCDALRASLPSTHPNQGGPCLPAGHSVLFVIATAPNPTNSQLALSFDRTIESIERAAGDRGFLFDRFVFPWDAEPNNRRLDPDKKRAEERRRHDSESQPGMLLFRWPFDKQDDPMHRFELLAVMLYQKIRVRA